MTDKLEIEWDYYLQGFRLHQRMTKESNLQAQVMLTKAIEMGRVGDRNIARAYGLRSFVILTAWLNDWIDQGAAALLLYEAKADVKHIQKIGLKPDPTLQAAIDAINLLSDQDPPEKIVNPVITFHAAAAANFDPTDYDNHWSLGTALLYGEQPGPAETSYQKAETLAANNKAPDISQESLKVDRADKLFYCAPLGNNNDVQKAINEVLNAINEAATNAPNDPKRFRWNWTLGWAYYENDEFDKSLAALEAIRNPHDLIIKNLIASYVGRARDGDLVRAQKLAKEFMERNPGYTRDVEDRWPYQDDARRDRFKKHLEDAKLP